MKFLFVSLVLALAACLCAAEDEEVTLIPYATSLGLTSLVEALPKGEGVVEKLHVITPKTVFAPTNDAFNSASDEVAADLEDPYELGRIVMYHIVGPKMIKFSELSNEQLLPTTLEGKSIRINFYTVGGDSVTTAQCAVINRKQVDKQAHDGIIHVLDDVMKIPVGNVIELLSFQENFMLLLTAIIEADLDNTLMGDGPFTVFAPTDDAFDDLPEGYLDYLLLNPDVLKDVLLYHVVSGTFCSAGLPEGAVKTLQGQDLDVQFSDAGATVNGNDVIDYDLSVSNGVVHVIDTVLLPPNFQIPESSDADEEADEESE